MACISSLIDSIIALISSLFSTSSSSSSLSPSSSSSPSPSPSPSPSSSSSSSPSPSSSSSSIPYDVFLSFRGHDTRYNFTDHLYHALDNRGIRTFRDDKLKRGEEIAPELLKVIEESRFSIIVFSENYADSRWCLDELVWIMECKKDQGQTVFPIFYRVDPSHVRNQRGSFGEAFAKYKEDTKEKKEKVQRWRTALTEAANLSGEHVKDDGYELEHIKEITNEIFKRLNPKFLHIDDDMVGIDFRLKELKLLLSSRLNDLNEVGVIGIYGTGGIGKTTIAKIVYNEIQCQFNGASFLQDVRERSKNGHQLQLLQQLLGGVMGKDVEFSDINEGINIIKGRLSSKKVLIVIDDVDHLEQLKLLVGNRKWFGPGSRIFITTRDKHLLDHEYEVDISYEVKQLNYGEAIQLFSKHAFKHNIPKEDYVKLSNYMVNYAQGLPLALKVLGSSLRGMTIDQWENALEKLKKNPKKEINKVLRISFDGLDDLEKEVFLDIACFFKSEHEDTVLRILDGCNLFATCGIRVLCDRCLVTISYNTIRMHDLIQQMGWAIVREECLGDPSKWSRLWDMDDIYDAFLRQGGMKNIQTISLDLSRSKEIEFTRKAFAKMKKLRLLKVYCNDQDGLTREEYKVLLPKDFEFPHNLRYLHWEGCTLRSLPSKFYGEKLIEINLKSSNVKQLWKGNKCLGKLKVIDLSNSKRLIKMPTFSSMPNLERLNLEGCTSLCELHSSIGDLKGLTYLNLGGCEQLQSFPTNMKFESLEVLYLNRCPNLKKFPEIHGNMEHLKKLYLNGSGIKELLSSIGYLKCLELLDLSHCSKFEKFPEIHGNMKFLRELRLVGCSKFEKFPDTFTYMEHLRNLLLCGSGIKELPSSIGYLESLENLNLSGCSKFEKFPEIRGNMKCLKTLDLEKTAITELPNSIGCLEALQFLYLSGCSNFEKFPEIQNNMGSLWSLHLDDTAIKELPCSIGHLTRLAILKLENCRNLRGLPNTICGLKSLTEAFTDVTEDMEHLKEVYLGGTGITELPSSIEHLRGLQYLELNKCEKLETLPNSIGTCLRSLDVRNCSKLHNSPDNLRSLDLEKCKNLRSLPNRLVHLRSLQCCLMELDLGGCNLMEGEIPSDLWCLSSLQHLHLSENHIRSIPAGITQLSMLETLSMNHCPMLEEIGELPSSLEWIEAHGCPCLETETSWSLLWSSLLKLLKSPIKKRCSIVVPGSSGIPEWVSHKRMGCEVKIELPMNWYEDNNLLGFLLFFHHVPLHHDDCETTDGDDCDTTFDNMPQCKLTISHGDSDQSEKVGGLIYTDFCHNSGSTSDPAMSVMNFPQIEIPSKYRSRRWNNFKAHFHTPIGGGSFTCGNNACFKVKSCGIHLMYAEDQNHWPQPIRESPGDTEDHPTKKLSIL